MYPLIYDIIILGAGISGLLIGSELSKHHSILMIEKEPGILSNKYWLTNKKCCDQNEELIDAIDSKYKFMDFISCYDHKYRCFGEYHLWDSEKLVRKLETMILDNAGIILRDTTFYSFSYSKNSIDVRANTCTFRSKLIIDCMGYSSPIIYAKNLIDIYGYYILIGSILKLKKSITPIGLGNIALNKNPKYLEVFPKSNNEAYVALIEPEKGIKKNHTLSKELKFLIERSEYSRYFEKNDTPYSLHGLIPVGRMKAKSLDRIFLFGETSQMNPGATATCLTQLLYSYKEIAAEISRKIKANKLTKNNLSIDTPHLTKRNRKFHLSLFKGILKWNSDDFSKLIQQMNNMDNKLVNDIIFGEIDFNSIVNLDILIHLIRNRNFFVLKPLLKSLLY